MDLIPLLTDYQFDALTNLVTFLGVLVFVLFLIRWTS